MRTRVLIACFGWSLVACASCCWGQEAGRFQPRELADLEIFQEGFPRTLLFRSGEIERWQRAGKLDDLLPAFNGNTIKYAGEEGNDSPDLPGILSAFKQRYPRELCLLHLNGEARKVVKPYTDRYFPGHWVTYAGETLSEDLAADSNTIRVVDPQAFARRQYSLRRGNQVVGKSLPSIIVVPLDDQGNRLWYESEYAQVTAVDTKASTLTVKRAQLGSRARPFKAKRSYVAPLHCEHWNGLMWTLNMSTECPRDRNGDTAADICLREMTEWCSAGGPATHVDGIGFDVIYYLAKYNGWDLDNDGKADDGIAADGRRFQLEGVHDLLKRLRATVGDDFLLSSDGWEPRNQRALGLFNGMESEGLCAPNDAWRMYARPLNTHTYWNENNNTKYRYSYITAKMTNPEDAANAASLQRLGLATACVLGVSYTGPLSVGRIDGLPMIPEMHQGQANRFNWLGNPRRPMILLPRGSADLLAGQASPFGPALVSRITAKRCSLSLDAEGSLLITPTSSYPYDTMEITLKDIPVPQGDLTVCYEAQAVDPLTGFDPSNRIPRLVTLHADGLPAYEGDRARSSPYNDITGYMGTARFTPQYGYFRRAGEGRKSIDLTFTFEDQGACKLRNLTAHNAPMAIVRDFENGMVLLNASEQPVTINLSQATPGTTYPLLRRIKADPAAYAPAPHVEDMLSHNDGRVEDPLNIEVPPLDALFLEKATGNQAPR